jgi:hypothetical protein
MKKLLSLALTSTFIVVLIITSIGVLKVNNANAEKPIAPKTYEPYYYSGTMSWCCFDGATACLPYNC